MRIAVVTESFLPTVNGVTNSVCKVLDHLALRGHEAIVVTPAAGSPKDYRGFRVVEVPALDYRQFPVGLPSPRVDRFLAEFAPDVVHAASPLFLGSQAIAAAKRRGIPSVAVFQTDVAGYTKRNKLSAMEGFAWWFIRWLHNNADLTLAPSSAALGDLRRAKITNATRWGRGVDLETYHPRNKHEQSVRGSRKRLGADSRTIIGYVGRLAPEKQVERLASLRGLDDVQLVVVGDGPSEPSIRKALKGVPVHFAGRLGGRDLAMAYASFDVFVHTGTEETFGQTIQEAHASGLPVVAPYAGGPIDLIEHGVDGFHFDPDRAGDLDLRVMLEKLVDAPELRARMGEAGRRRVLSRSWESVCDELLSHYADVLAEARRPVTLPLA
ncbi:glycosyl transferase [Pseudoclavibacter sp. RFBI5]|uniref:glycosyltransferase family 4 protein n=1 Tax=Pseudoclavibacter sp. RFBI5 TaxID=2080578 RepID=UPI000CE7C613|nr:glycosyltransferase family 1 protein [Pseudoclavibacter sp. RFBI5]PPG04981.1 glycosyl transferase [Pseudoclavibacter sp. RFBI5]